MIIYKLTFRNGKSYIGQTMRNLSVRLKEHRKASNGLPVSRAWKVHGFPCVEILAECTSLDELNAKEDEMIRLYDTIRPNGYNICPGGAPVPTRNPEIARQIGETLKGRKYSAESRAKMSASASARIRKPHSEETKAKIAASNKGHDGKLRAAAISNAKKGFFQRMTSEQQAAFSESRKRAWATRRARSSQEGTFNG